MGKESGIGLCGNILSPSGKDRDGRTVDLASRKIIVYDARSNWAARLMDLMIKDMSYCEDLLLSLGNQDQRETVLTRLNEVRRQINKSATGSWLKNLNKLVFNRVVNRG